MSKNLNSDSTTGNWWLWTVERDEIKKIGFISGIFGALIFTYSLIRPLKDSIFIGFVGAAYIPWARLLMIAMIPLFLPIYSAASNRTKRETATILFSLIYAIGCLTFAALFMHPIIGLTSTLTTPTRIIGWLFFGFLDFYPIAVIATFWAMLSSISTPNSARKQYGFMVTVSKLTGALSAGIAYILAKLLPATLSIPIDLGLAAIGLLVTVFLIRRMFLVVPQKFLTGYRDTHAIKDRPSGAMSGLKTVLTQPYAFGILWLLFSFELVSTILDFRMQCSVATQTANSIKEVSSFFLGYTFVFQIVGFFLALFGTTGLLKWIGVKRTLLLTPCVIFLMTIILVFFDNLTLVSGLMVALRALEFSIETPVREILFIPTARNIQIHAKGWIASFGKTLPKTSGALFNGLTQVKAVCGTVSLFVTVAPVAISFIWICAAFFTGKRYEQAVSQDELIS